MLWVTGGHLDFKCSESSLGVSVKKDLGAGEDLGGGEKNRVYFALSVQMSKWLGPNLPIRTFTLH